MSIEFYRVVKSQFSTSFSWTAIRLPCYIPAPERIHPLESLRVGHMIATTVRRRTVVLASVLSIVFAGVPSPRVLAAPRHLNKQSQVRLSQLPTADQILAGLDLVAIRAELQLQASATNQRFAREAQHLLVLLDIATAPTAEARYELITKLSVNIVRTPARDGRHGVVERFVVDGKTRFQMFVPATPPATDEPDDAIVSGPSAGSSMVNCYDGPPPCISWAAMNNLGATIAQGQSELENDQVQYNESCDVDPTDCSFPAAWVSGSGPSDCMGCAAQAGDALVTLASSGATLLGAYATYADGIAAGLTLTTLGAATILSSVAAASFAAGYFVSKWWHCAHAIEPSVGPVETDPVAALMRRSFANY